MTALRHSDAPASSAPSACRRADIRRVRVAAANRPPRTPARRTSRRPRRPPASSRRRRPSPASRARSSPSEQVAAVVGTAPIEIKERAGRGDCDYWLDAAKTSKVNIGVTTGAGRRRAVREHEGARRAGRGGQPRRRGLSISLEADLGTLVMVKQGDAVAAVQVLTTAEPAEQAIQAIALAQAVLARPRRASAPAYNLVVPIYLDHAATTPLRPEALEAMLPFFGGEFGNPSSPHAYGRRARAALDVAHERIARRRSGPARARSSSPAAARRR